jgi:lysyl-tRNA synthetase class 2
MLSGRIQAFRMAGSKLVFVNFAQEGHSVQGVCDFSRIKKENSDPEDFNKFVRSMRRGDVFSKI